MADGGVHVQVCVFVRCPVTPRMGLKALFFCFHKHPVRLLTLLLIEALDLQLSYANYFSDLKLAPPASAFSFRCTRSGGYVDSAVGFWVEAGAVGVSCPRPPVG